MSNQKSSPDNVRQQMQESWEHGIARAQQERRREQELGQSLSQAAGLQVKSGHKAGGLFGSHNCNTHNNGCWTSLDFP
ncbi:MAG TPA: hypothetical protein VFD70_19325 [Anaerolineae bacterium]|nr:hypothetical protein [Anaerolineae bacterium]